MYFVAIAVLILSGGLIVTVAKEVPSRVQCDAFIQDIRDRHGDKVVMTTCERWISKEDEDVSDTGLSDG